MSTDVARKLAFLCKVHRITPEQFVEEFAITHVNVRRCHLREWVNGGRNPHGKSLDQLTNYWSRHFEKVENFWWNCSFVDFVALHDAKSDGVLTPAMHDAACAALPFTEAELASLCGTYRTFRRSFNDDTQIVTELMHFRSDDNSNNRLATRIFSYSGSDGEPLRFNIFNGYTYRNAQCYFLIVFGGPTTTPQMRSAYLSLTESAHKAISRMGLILGVSDKERIPIASRLILARSLEKNILDDPDKIVRRCPLDEIPEMYRDWITDGRMGFPNFGYSAPHH